jgi:regulatory protein
MLANKARSIKDDDPWKRRNKLIRFGLSRGFDYDTVLKSLPEDIASED